MKWIEALKIYRETATNKKIPRKGTEEHAEVLRIMNSQPIEDIPIVQPVDEIVNEIPIVPKKKRQARRP